MVWFLLPSARFPHPLPPSDWIAIVLQCVIDWGGMFGNIAVLLAIVLKSPTSWRSFKILLAMQAIVDLVSVIACNFIIERMIPAPFGTTMVFLGACTIFSPAACHTAHSVMMNLQTFSYYVVAASIIYRLYILKRKAPSYCTMFGICSAMLILPIIMITLSLHIVDDENEVREAFRAVYNLDQYVVQGHIHPRLALTISAIYNLGSCWPMTLIVFTVRRKVLGTLEKQRATMSEKTLDMHRVLVKILTLHACLPIINTLAVSFYVIGKSGHHSLIIEHTQRVISSMMGLISPYISIFNIKTFRDFVCCRAGTVSVKLKLNHLSIEN